MKQREKNKKNFLKYGTPEDLSEKLVQQNYTVSKVRVASNSDLAVFLNSDEIKTIKNSVKRQKISEDVFKKLVHDSELMCCFCWNIDDNKPVVIHHIEEYSRSQNNEYENLVVVCLNHHAEIHTISQISQDNYPPQKIYSQKEKWTQSLQDFRKGLRIAPGREPKGSPEVQIVNSPNSVVSFGQTGGQTAKTINNISFNSSGRIIPANILTEISEVLSLHKGKNVIIRIANNEKQGNDPVTFAEGLHELFQASGWSSHLSNSGNMIANNVIETGVIISSIGHENAEIGNFIHQKFISIGLRSAFKGYATSDDPCDIFFNVFTK